MDIYQCDHFWRGFSLVARSDARRSCWVTRMRLRIIGIEYRSHVVGQRLQEADERIQAEMTERKRAEENFVRAQME